MWEHKNGTTKHVLGYSIDDRWVDPNISAHVQSCDVQLCKLFEPENSEGADQWLKCLLLMRKVLYAMRICSLNLVSC